MPAVQTTYSDNQPIAVHGMPATMSTYDADTKTVETAAGIGFGLAVSRGATLNSIVVGGAAFDGITMRDITQVNGADDEYPVGANASVLKRGDIWLKVGVAVAVTDPVGFDATTGVIAKTGTRIINASWVVPAGIGGFAMLRMHSPNPATEAIV